MGSIISAVRYQKSGKIKWKPATVSAVFSLCGASIGAQINLRLDPSDPAAQNTADSGRDRQQEQHIPMQQINNQARQIGSKVCNLGIAARS